MLNLVLISKELHLVLLARIRRELPVFTLIFGMLTSVKMRGTQTEGQKRERERDLQIFCI